ncbi:hypothetical protein [Aeromicrobium sp. Sec7.5]
MDQQRREPIDWRKTIRFTLWWLSPVILLGVYLLGIELFGFLVFRNFGV